MSVDDGSFQVGHAGSTTVELQESSRLGSGDNGDDFVKRRLSVAESLGALSLSDLQA